jgi:hypothetical protein
MRMAERRFACLERPLVEVEAAAASPSARLFSDEGEFSRDSTGLEDGDSTQPPACVSDDMEEEGDITAKW